MNTKKHKVVINNDYGGYFLSEEAKEYLSNCGIEDAYSIPRHHPCLVKCVETLGGDAGNSCSDLVVVEIEGNQYRICEYDGKEWVETPSDLDWVTIE